MLSPKYIDFLSPYREYVLWHLGNCCSTIDFVLCNMSSKQPTYEELIRQLQEAEQKREEERKRKEEERKRKEEERKRKEEERKRKEEEQRRHLVEEELGQEKELSRPTSLPEALCLWHTLYSNPTIHYRPGKTSVSHFTSATKRLRPKSLRPWHDFNKCHRQAWNEVIRAYDCVESVAFDSKSSYQTEANPFMPTLVLHNENDLVGYAGRTLEQQVTSITKRIGMTMTFKDREGREGDSLATSRTESNNWMLTIDPRRRRRNQVEGSTSCARLRKREASGQY